MSVVGSTLRRFRAADRPTKVLIRLLIVGALFRLALISAYRPIFIGYPDSGPYLYDAFAAGHPFYDPLRMSGYATVVRLLHGLTAHLGFVSLVQHCLGLAVAVMLFTTLRVAGVRSRWAGILPAAIVLLSGVEIMFEHALITETVWLALVALSLLTVVAAASHDRPARTVAVLAVATGLLLGLSVTVRLPSLFLMPVLLLWFLFASGGGWPRRLATTAAMLLAALAPLLGYAEWQKHDTGRFGLSRNGALNLYGRVAPWADCTKFTPPKGTEFLCETKPVTDRQGHDAYIFAPSPATTHYNVASIPLVLSAKGSKELSAWSRAAILGQPFTYLTAVLRESRRIITPGTLPGLRGQKIAGFGLAPHDYFPLLTSTQSDASLMPLIAENYGAGATKFKRGNVKWLDTYDRITRVRPFWMALLIALALMAPFVTRGPERRAAWLLTPAAVVLLEGPVATSIYDFRYIVPVLGILGAAASIGLWGVVTSTRGWWAARRGAASSESAPVSA